MAALIGLLKFIEYRYLVRDLSAEVYIGVVAVFFTALGIWVGLKLTRKPETGKTVPTESTTAILNKYKLSKRELEVLTLIAQGHSNKEIAEALFLSTNTIKTHSSNIFSKLDVKRRTQAVQKAIEVGILNSKTLSD